MPSRTKPEPFISLAAAGEHLSCNEVTIRRMIASGQLPAYRFGPRAIRVRLSEVESALRPIPAVAS